MTLFQRYFAVDWPANNGPKLGKDSVWIAEQGAGEHEVRSVNLPTRHAAMAHLRERFLAAVEAGERVLAGFDFPFGFPAGAAQRLAGQGGWAAPTGSLRRCEPGGVGLGGWAALWKMLAQEISDDEANRFEVACRLNERLGVGGARFWGAPKSAATPHLDLDKKRADFAQVG